MKLTVTTMLAAIYNSIMLTGTNLKLVDTANNFIIETLHQMVPWLMVMFMAITTDLVAGIRKRWLMRDSIRISKGLRDTGAKMVTYFAIVVTAVMVGQIMCNTAIPYYTIGAIYLGEGLSILGNLIKPKGYDINLSSVISLIFKKLFNIDKDYSKDVLQKNERHVDNNNKTRVSNRVGEVKELPTGTTNSGSHGSDCDDEDSI